LSLINDILDFSRIEAGKLNLENIGFDLSNLLDDFGISLALRAQEKGLELLCSTDSQVPLLLCGDPGRLRQILTNLAGNAIKFTSAGEVCIRVTTAAETPETVLLRFSIRDSGIGIPKEKQGLLFNKFSQVDTSTTRHHGGTGLGLAISKQLAALMGGQIGVVSEEGKGSEFWFTARLAKQIQKELEEVRPKADINNIRALIVDDNRTNRQMLSSILTSWKMRTAEVPSGFAALQALYQAVEEGDPFRFAIIDMQMPGMDGEALGLAIRADKRLVDTSMVMMTSVATRGDARRFADIGFAAYLPKPVRYKELKGLLTLTLALGKPQKFPERKKALSQAQEDRQSSEPRPPILTRHRVHEIFKQSGRRHARVLIVDDNDTNQQVALSILIKLGLHAHAVDNGMKALKALETSPYDLVLMDVQMPGMDGLEATRQIRDLQSPVLNHSIPIIAMTAHAMQSDRELCLASGMNDYLTKPINALFLAAAIEKHLSQDGADIETSHFDIQTSDSPLPGRCLEAGSGPSM
jgi:CheY-like chemotaxis protein